MTSFRTPFYRFVARLVLAALGLVAAPVLAPLPAHAQQGPGTDIVAEFLGGPANPATNNPGYFGQSFTTATAVPENNITFSFEATPYSTTNPYALGTAYLLSSPYTGVPFALSSKTPGFLGMATASRGVYNFGASLTLQPNTQYFLYENVLFPEDAIYGGGQYAGGKFYYAISTLPLGRFTPDPGSNSACFLVTGTPLSPPYATATSLTSSLNPSVGGQSVTFTATVAPANPGTGTPTGSVQFAIDGANVGGPVTINGSGKASDTEAALAAGTHTVTVTYAPTGAFSGNAGATLTQNVTPRINPQYVSPSGSDSNDGSQASPRKTIQAAINTTLSGDTVIVEDGTYAGAGNVEIDISGKNLTVQSVHGASATVIDGGGSHRGFCLHGGGAQALISGFTVRNGSGTYGGGICVQGTALNNITVQNCVVTGSTATYGGGIYSENYGGGTITLSNCVATGNTATYGGGIFNVSFAVSAGATIRMTGCTAAGNTATSGGGVLNDNEGSGGTITLTNCTVTGNRANGGGSVTGGAFNADSVFSANAGGGVFSANVAAGAAITLTSCTVTGNQADSGGAYCENVSGSSNASITLTDCILYGDVSTAGTSNEAFGSSITGSSIVFNFCDVQGGYAGTGNINADPLFVSAAAGDFHLRPGSPCLGTGVVVAGLIADKDGTPRPTPPSIGAYELASSPASSWSAIGVSAGADGYTRILWDNASGQATVWKVAASGNLVTQQLYGPYAGWTARAIATGTDNRTRLLWTHTSGQATVWTLDSNNAVTAQQVYGPYANWTATAIAAAPDGTARLLWDNTSGQATVWTLDSGDNMTTQQQYGPYSGWTAKSLAANPDGTQRLLWTNTSGQATFWKLTSASQLQSQQTYGPYSGWTAQSIASAPDGTGRVVWVNSDAHITLWNIDANNALTTQFQFGPFSAWAIQSLAVGSDGSARLLWDNTSGQAALWGINPGGMFAFNYQYGPY